MYLPLLKLGNTGKVPKQDLVLQSRGHLLRTALVPTRSSQEEARTTSGCRPTREKNSCAVRGARVCGMRMKGYTCGVTWLLRGLGLGCRVQECKGLV